MREPGGLNIWARLAVLGAMVFFASGFVSIGEVGYAIWGRTTTANVRAPRNGLADDTSVRYSFQDVDGTRRTERDRVTGGWRPPADGNVRIEFVPGREGKSRVAGNRNDTMIGIFIGSMLFSLFMFLAAWHRSYREHHPVVRHPRQVQRLPSYVSAESFTGRRFLRRIKADASLSLRKCRDC
jgi:hypothetical protein